MARWIDPALVAICVVATLATPSPTWHANTEHRSRGYFVPASDTGDLMPLLSDGGPTVLLRDHSHRTDNKDWMKFDRDACGMLQRVDNRRSLLRFSAFDDEDFEDDPSIQGRLMVGQWLSTHPEIAAISDGVDKDCLSPMDIDYEDTANVA